MKTSLYTIRQILLVEVSSDGELQVQRHFLKRWVLGERTAEHLEGQLYISFRLNILTGCSSAWFLLT
mgnify:CR=1 FL=1